MTVLSDPVVDNSSGTVSVEFIVTDDGIPIVDLTSDAVTLSEAADNIALTWSYERQLNLAIAVDLSFGSDADLVRDTLRAFFDNYYRSGDRITIYILDASVESNDDFRIISIDSLETAYATLDELDRADRLFSVEPMFLQIFEDLQEIPDTLMNSRQVLFVGSFLNRPSDAQYALNFAENNIAVHGVQAHRTREDFTTTYRGLANTGGGLFANNYEGIFVIPGDVYQPINNLKVLYDTIGNSRVIYRLQWTTRNPSLEADRSVELELEALSGSIAVTTVDYTFEFQPPQVEFNNQASFDVTRQIFRVDNETIRYGLDERLVPVLVSFPDGVERELASLRLEIIDMQSGDVLQSDLLVSPESDDGQYVLTWDLTEFITPASVLDIELAVTVTDELGLMSESRESGSVTLPSPPPTTTPIPTDTPTATPTPDATATPIAVVNNNLFGQSVSDTNSSPLLFLLLIIVILVIILAYMLVRTIRIQRAIGQHDIDSDDPQTREPVAPVTDNMPEEIEETRFAQMVTLDESGADLDIDHLWITRQEMTVGRGENCDLVINTPILDEEHCIIKVKKANAIYIRDSGTINGTFVNGERIRESEDVFLPMNTEFSLTRQLKFKLLPADAQLEEDVRYSTQMRSTVMSEAERVPFKKIDEKLNYADDDGPPVDDNYSPL